MDENDSLSEYNKIPLGHNRTNGAVYFKIYFKGEICSTFSIFESHPTTDALFSALILLNPNNHYNHVFLNTFDYNRYVYSNYLVCYSACYCSYYTLSICKIIATMKTKGLYNILKLCTFFLRYCYFSIKNKFFH